MYNEYDVVRLISKIPGSNIPIGARGTILIIYQDSPGNFEVEFMSANGQTFGVVTVSEDHLVKVEAK